MLKKKKTERPCAAGPQPHAWRGSWNRPVEIDECSLDPLTTARMTDHNVRGRDNGVADPRKPIKFSRKKKS